MSVNRNYYIIAGYDLTGLDTDKFNEWKWTEDGEKYTCNQVKEEIQLFYDPMNGEHLYLGYILACGNEYEFKTTKIDTLDISYWSKYVAEALCELQEIGVISKDYEYKDRPKYQVIIFKECT